MKKTNTKTRTLLEIINDKDIKEILTVDLKSPVIEALTIMAKYKIGALIVLKEKKMVGIISERIIRYGFTGRFSKRDDSLPKRTYKRIRGFCLLVVSPQNHLT